ncbi:MAG TPA: hypothetical protein VMF89_06115, partial [Polyangiales bacterium]|nr:hypothetical protein [Polyangiales bacterium]
MIACFACDSHQSISAPASWELVCIDVDGDGHGFQCGMGDDCDDADPLLHEGCERSCRTANEGCACDAAEPPRSCSVSYSLDEDGSLLCASGTRHCRDGRWSACEGVKTFAVPPSTNVLTRALLNDDAGVLTCSPCRPDCFRVDDPLGVA